MSLRPDPKPEKQSKKSPKPIKRSPLKKERKVTGERNVFEEIAEEREWICFVTGEKLWELKPSQFLHVLPKALNRFPKYKLYKENVVLASDLVHRMWDFAPRSEVKKDKRFNKLFALESELKAKYPNTD